MKFEAMKQALIAAAQKAGVEQYEIYYEMEESLSADTMKQEINSFSSSVSGGICFRCIVNGKMGYASGELMTEEAMENLVASAISNAACIDSEDEVFIFPGSPAYATLPERTFKLNDAVTVKNTALALQKATYEQNEAVSDGTQCGSISATSEVHLYNSHGLELSNRAGVNLAYVDAIVRKGEDAQSGFEFSEGATFEDVKELPAKAVEVALSKFGASTVETGKYNVVIDGKTFRSFLSTFSSVFSAKNAQMGLSLLAGKEGEQIAAPCVSIVDDPMREGCPFQSNFDGEGVATARRDIIKDGVLTTLLYDLTTAKKAGVESTGHGQKHGYSSPVSISPYNLGICAGDATREELLADAKDGIFINECKGFHAGANPVTGDFSIESAGYRIRDGKLAEPIKSFTIAGNFFTLLKEIDRLGDKTLWGQPTSSTVFGSPDVLLRDASIAGK
ncbi:MAG: TldD/PmbA family protein [Clostridia bacterium]|nr:TldD/PmbA family protein [Clostridia bacterium]